MDRKNNIIKPRLSSKRNMQKISQVVSVVLALVFFFFIGIIAYNISNADRMRAEAEREVSANSPIAANKGRDYGTKGFQRVAENEQYTMYADFTTGEISVKDKENKKTWYSNPQDREEDKLIAIRSNLSAQLFVKYIDIKNTTTKEEDNYSGSIQQGGMDYELVENGVKFKFSFPATGVVIPVQYTLCEDGLLAEIISDEIDEQWNERYLVESIALLPFFGAGGLSDDGYLFVPDGSGALINYNNNKQRFQTYTDKVYGRNITLLKNSEGTLSEHIHMPVFGAKCNDDAFVAVITSGEAESIISAAVSRKTSSYNQVYSRAVYREYSLKSMSQSYFANASSRYDYSENLLSGHNYSVLYMFLGEDKADYSGMSARYREYLLKSNQLKDSDLADKNYLVLDLYGAVSIEKYVLGVKRPVLTALTTYNDVCEIVKQLKSQGVQNLIINYIGALDSGLDNKIIDEVKAESVLGTKKELQEMINYLSEENVLLFMETNPVDLYKSGNGYTENGDSVRSFFNEYGFQYKYELDTKNVIEDSRWHLMKPQNVPEVVKKFAESASLKNVKQVSLARLGEVLYSDYEQGESFTSRVETQAFWKKAMENAIENVDYLMVHEGNIYSVPYADVITDVSMSSSYYDMADQSIPFYQMVLHGNIVMASKAINTTVDYNYSFLKALETGCSLRFSLIDGEVTELIGTKYNDMVSYSYEQWVNTVVEGYRMLHEATKEIAGQVIVSHEMLSEDVYLTVYETGASIIVNYGKDAYKYGSQLIEPRGYHVLGGGAK